MAPAKKCRDADHMSCLMYDLKVPDDATINAALADSSGDACEFEQRNPHEWFCTTHKRLEIGKEPVFCSGGRVEVPDYAHDFHTPQGRKRGKTKTQSRGKQMEIFTDSSEALRRACSREVSHPMAIQQAPVQRQRARGVA